MPSEWSCEHRMISDTLERILANPLVLDFPSWDDLFMFQIDARLIEVGAVLARVIQDMNFIVGFARRRFLKRDSNRGPIECEYMVVLYSVAHFRQYLAGRRLNPVTDCSALSWLFRSKNLSPRLDRWAY